MLIDMSKVKIDPAWTSKIPASIAIRRQVMPFLFMDNKVHVACIDERNNSGIRSVEQAIDLPIKIILAEKESLKSAIKEIYGNNPTANTPARNNSSNDPTPLSSEILNAAIMKQASDIHIDPDKDELRIRFRVDGRLEDFRNLSMTTFSALMSRLKVLAGMDIAEKRSPQDGYINHQSANGNLMEMRVATLPTKYGEKMTLRLMDMGSQTVSLKSLGFNEKDLKILEAVIAKPHGMILITGPTGSGKSTTLYSSLIKLKNSNPCNIVTIEDPVEYDLSGVSQVEVDHQKMTFASALKSVLRHDPDIVMVGEMRDKETAEIAIKASMTGHLVLSTLHTNSAPGAITRLVDMGIEPFLVAATVELVMAQRLVRKLCQHCHTENQIDAKQAYLLGNPELEGKTSYSPKGCLYCGGKGYSGRVGLFEMLPITHKLARGITEGIPEGKITADMHEQGNNTLKEDGIEKILSGLTSVEEVIRAIG
ncbi:MAG: GspE/PulE family protein [Lentisphaerales bacterium]|nr:GspE/PulE family protein [Lentisphaerales bacterium]